MVDLRLAQDSFMSDGKSSRKARSLDEVMTKVLGQGGKVTADKENFTIKMPTTTLLSGAQPVTPGVAHAGTGSGEGKVGGEGGAGGGAMPAIDVPEMDSPKLGRNNDLLAYLLGSAAKLGPESSLGRNLGTGITSAIETKWDRETKLMTQALRNQGALDVAGVRANAAAARYAAGDSAYRDRLITKIDLQGQEFIKGEGWIDAVSDYKNSDEYKMALTNALAEGGDIGRVTDELVLNEIVRIFQMAGAEITNYDVRGDNYVFELKFPDGTTVEKVYAR